MDLQIIEITYGKTINIGNYESVRLDLTARVPEGKSHQEVIDRLKVILAEEEQVIRQDEAAKQRKR